jgi:hypothetical protein
MSAGVAFPVTARTASARRPGSLTAVAARTRPPERACEASTGSASARSAHSWLSSIPTGSAVPAAAAVRRLIAAHAPEYLGLLEQELVAQGGGRDD